MNAKYCLNFLNIHCSSQVCLNPQKYGAMVVIKLLSVLQNRMSCIISYFVSPPNLTLLKSFSFND